MQILSTLTSFFFSGLFSYGWASLLLIFNVWFHTYDIVIVFGQLFATKALLKLVRHIVMRVSYSTLYSGSDEGLSLADVQMDQLSISADLLPTTSVVRCTHSDS